MLELHPVNWVMQHKEGQWHVNADALSRRPQNPGSGDEWHPSDTEQSDIMLSSPPSAVDPGCTSDLTTGEQVDTDRGSDMSFMYIHESPVLTLTDGHRQSTTTA